MHSKAVLLRSNFGKSAALMAGFEQAAGEIVITMDADLQDDPVEIPRFVTKIEDGFDFVSGWKRIRQDSLEKRLPSRVFNYIVRKTSAERRNGPRLTEWRLPARTAPNTAP